jgi:transposase InsO family protein
MKDLEPEDHGEAVAIFRQSVVGRLTRRDLEHGELHEELIKLSEEHLRPPSAERTRSFSVPTLERWYYALKGGGLPALRPKGRGTGHALTVSDAMRELLLEIRREYRSASASLIRRTLITEGALEAKALSEPTLRRFYIEHGLPRLRRRDVGHQEPKKRLRWQAARPGALWQGDVCHGAPLVVGNERHPVRIHALIDDASRYIVGIEAMHTEREVDMLSFAVDAFRRHGLPDALYLDNGSTYRGETLRVACARLGVALLHPQPRDPEARGKIERFFRTLREGCLDFIGNVSTLHDVNVRIHAWIDEHYHKTPHAGLMGRSPAKVWKDAERERAADDLDEKKLRDALTVREQRRVRRDTTVSLEGTDYELDQGFLAGKTVSVAFCPLDHPLAPWVEYQGKRYDLHPVNPQKNAKRRRAKSAIETKETKATTKPRFEPAKALLDKISGRLPARKNKEDHR